MHDEGVAAGVMYLTDKIHQLFIAIPAIDADTVLDGNRDVAGIQHRLHAIGHQLRVAHQTGADQIVLHPITGAADVQVHLGITGLLRQPGALRQFLRIAATQLQRQRLLLRVITEKPLAIAVQYRAGGDHFGVQQGVAADQAGEIAIMPV